MSDQTNLNEIAYSNGVANARNLMQSLPEYSWEGVIDQLRAILTLVPGPDPLVAEYLRGSLITFEKGTENAEAS